jgi:hypothetical protein
MFGKRLLQTCSNQVMGLHVQWAEMGECANNADFMVGTEDSEAQVRASDPFPPETSLTRLV